MKNSWSEAPLPHAPSQLHLYCYAYLLYHVRYQRFPTCQLPRSHHFIHLSCLFIIFSSAISIYVYHIFNFFSHYISYYVSCYQLPLMQYFIFKLQLRCYKLKDWKFKIRKLRSQNPSQPYLRLDTVQNASYSFQELSTLVQKEDSGWLSPARSGSEWQPY